MLRAMRNFALAFAGISISVFASACGGGDTPPPATPTGGTASGAPTDKSIPAAATKPASDKCTWKKTNTKTCHVNAKSDGDLSAAVADIGKGCIDPKMKPIGAAETGDSSTMVKTVPVKVQANHCYRVIGLAQASVTDFDIAVMASDGKSCGEDLNDSNDAIVLEDGVICFSQDDTVNVNAAVAQGTGKWAFQVWSD